MENYICIKGKKTALTLEQLKELGFSIDSPLTDLVNEVRAGKRPFVPRTVIEDFGMKFKIIGYDHDVCAENPAACAGSTTVFVAVSSSGRATANPATGAPRVPFCFQLS